MVQQLARSRRAGAHETQEGRFVPHVGQIADVALEIGLDVRSQKQIAARGRVSVQGRKRSEPDALEQLPDGKHRASGAFGGEAGCGQKRRGQGVTTPDRGPRGRPASRSCVLCWQDAWRNVVFPICRGPVTIKAGNWWEASWKKPSKVRWT